MSTKCTAEARLWGLWAQNAPLRLDSIGTKCIAEARLWGLWAQNAPLRLDCQASVGTYVIHIILNHMAQKCTDTMRTYSMIQVD